MSLTGSRVESYRYELLDKQERFITVLNTVSEGQLEHNLYSDLRSGGSIRLVDTGLDWLDARVRITYIDGTDEYPLGVYLAASPGRRTNGVTTTRTVELYSKLLVLTQDKLETSFTLEADVVVTEAVRSVIASAGESRVAITDSDKTLTSAMVWSAGTPKLRIVNDLLAYINYFALSVDVRGFYVAQPYVPPADRPVAWAFADGQASIYLPDLSVDIDYFEVANKVVLVAGDAETEMVSIATDTDSPLGYTARGRWIVDYREGEDAADQSTLDARAARILAEARQVSEGVEVRHPYVPLYPADIVVITNKALGISNRYTVTGQRHDLRIGASVTTTVSRVVV